MMTARGWWCLFSIALMLVAGLLRGSSALTLSGLALLLWFAWEWLSFAVRMPAVVRRLRVERDVRDLPAGRGEGNLVTSLWAGQTYRMTARLAVTGRTDWLAHALASDPVPFAAELVRGEPLAQGAVSRAGSPELTYTFRCPHAGVARFEGLRVETADLCGFFYHASFVRQVVELRIFPALIPSDGLSPLTKSRNEMPPGIHRLRSAGSGSELLDLRDYQPGDPPRTIAWKLSAKRDRLVTREYESEVPVRVTLFLDASPSVRLPSPVPGRRRAPGTALHRLIDLTATLARSSSANRDLTGVVVFDAAGSRGERPGRGSVHQTRLLQLLGDAARLAPAGGSADVEALTPLGYALAEDLYPELLRDGVNGVPLWVTLFAGFPTYQRAWRGWWDLAFRRRGRLFLLGALLPPLGWFVTLILLVLAALNVVSVDTLFYGGLAALTVPAPLASLASLLGLFVLTFSWRGRRLARWRKKLATLLTARHSLGPDGLARLLEDDEEYGQQVQRFLAEHQVPCPVPLYDHQGRYQFACPEKVPVLARALLQGVGRGRDNELFILCADLLELDGHWEPLLQAVRVARARHHQVVLVCPWPPGLPLPSGRSQDAPTPPTSAADQQLRAWLAGLTTARYHAAHARLQKAFARLGVPLVCAAGNEPVPLILQHIDRLRAAGRGRTPGGRGS